MNVFVIPSWYPEPRYGLLGGVFLAEAVRALACHCPELNVSVSLWGQGDLEFSSARLRAWLAHPGGPGGARPARRQVSANLVEYFRPAWTWRYGFRTGNLAAIVRRNRENLERARTEHGRIHVLHAHVSFPAGAVARELSRETGIPFLVTEHMSPFPFRHLERAGQVVPEVREPLRSAQRVTAVSRSLAREIGERAGVEAVVVPNGVDETFFTPATPAGGSRANGAAFTFLTVGNLTPQKGVDDLLRAAAALASPDGVRFRIAGDGAQAAEYRALARRLGLEDHVTWLGALGRERVRDELRACDAFVLTSRHESFGVVLAEALACGRPVLATRSGGPEDIVTDANGVLVRVGDVPAITAALDRFVREAGRYEPRAIRADFEARFASRVVARRFADVYRELAGAA